MKEIKILTGKVEINPYGDYDDVDKGTYIGGEDIESLIQKYENKKIKITIEELEEVEEK